MPLAPSSIKALIITKASSKLVSGSKLPDMVTAISNATADYILSVSTVNSTNIALGPGAGTQTGKISALNPTTMSAQMMLKAGPKGLSGRDLKKLFDAVSFGVVNAMKTVVLQGTIMGAGPGIGTGKITGLVSTTLKAAILGQSFFRQVSGDKLGALIDCMAFGITNHIMSVGVINVNNIGAAAGPPAGPVTIPTAPGIGRLA